MKKLKIFNIALAFIFFISFNLVTADASTFKSEKVTVVSVYDGDTITVKKSDNKQYKVRLIGVNTPELKPVEHYGKEASEYTRKALQGKTVYLTYDVGLKDKYGRTLAYVWTSQPTSDSEKEIRSKMFNANLLLSGYGQVLTIQPNSKYSKLFTTFQAEAVNGKKGLWAKGSSKPSPQKPTTPNTSKLNDNSIVYYVQNGKSYHKTNKCSTLSRSKNIKSGKLKDVKKLKKTDPCNVCVK